MNSYQDNTNFDARVSYVLLDDSDKERFNKYGGYDSIGLIECYRIIDGYLDQVPIIALPINSNNRRFPVENEIVKIISSTSNISQNVINSKNVSFFYGDIIGTWGSIEHNSVPIKFDNSEKNQDKINNYVKNDGGIVKKSEENTDISITGQNFKETGNVRKLKHQPGDITYEGRFGNSIRIGGSNSKFNTPWKGLDNYPMIIISNNHGNVDKNNLDPIYENVNKDGSSIFILSGQTIDFIPANNNFESYNKKISIKSNIIQPVFEQKVNTSSSKQADEQNVAKMTLKEDVPVVYKTEVSSSNQNIIEDDITFLPDREDSQEGEIIFGEPYVLVVDPEYDRNIREMRKSIVNSIPPNPVSVKSIGPSEALKTYIIPKLNEIPNIPRGIRYLMEAQIFFEGFYPANGSRRASNSFRNNNPGNFVWDKRYAKYGAYRSVDKVGEGYGVTFLDLKSGLMAKRDYIENIRSGGSRSYKLKGETPLWNGRENYGYIDTYCPKSDKGANNDPLAYATFIISYFKGKGLIINYSITLNQLYSL